MQESRREFIDRFLAFVNELGDSNARLVAESLLNDCLLKFAIAHPWRELVLVNPIQLTTVANVATYILPPFFLRVASRDGKVRNLTTGDWIVPMTKEDLELQVPELGTALDTGRGDPSVYCIAGTVGVAVQPSAAGQALEAVSSSATDTDVVVTLEGTNSAGEWDVNQVTLTGTVAAALGTWKTPLQAFGKAFPQATAVPPTGALSLTSSRGTVTLRIVGGATLQTLLPHESAREQQQITFWQTPNAVRTIAIPAMRVPHRVFRDADTILLLWSPALFEEMDIQWRVNRGEISRGAAGSVARPAFLDLVSFDNEQRAGNRRWTKPFR